MKKILLLLFVLLGTVPTWAVQRSSEEALAIARSFFSQQALTRSGNDIQLVAKSGDLLKPTSTRSVPDGTAFYVYNEGQAAYVIVSGDDRMKPVLAYSDKGAFITENLPENLLAWLELYQAAYADWVNDRALRTEPYLMTRATFPKTIDPLLGDINWNQGAPYNNICPLVGGERCVTGCVATAMAMILKYYEHPVKGKGSHSYKMSNGTECSFDYGNTTFDWASMLPQYIEGKSTPKQDNAVAQLMYACGVAVDMQYSPNGSGAVPSAGAQALINYFDYNENLGYAQRAFFTSDEWMNLIKTELSEKRPVLYDASSTEVGHEFVFDGYDAQDMVHVNWGWGGLNNGYFEVASLNPSSPGIGGGTDVGHGYVFRQAMHLGLQPKVIPNGYVSRFYLLKLAVNKQKLGKGEAFDITITDFYNMTSTFKKGRLALIAEKEGKQSCLREFQLEKIAINYGLKSQVLSDNTIPVDLADGTYAFYLATKDEREKTWSRVRGFPGCETQFVLVVKGAQCVLTPFTGNLNPKKELDGRIELLHSLYGGRRGDFRMFLSNQNATTEFYGSAGVVFATKNENPQLIALVGGTQLLLKAGVQNSEWSISGDLISNLTKKVSDIPEGEYYVSPGVEWGEYVYGIGNNLLSVTVGKAFGSPTLTVNDARLEKDQLQVGEKLKLLANLSLSGAGNVYDKKLMAAIFTQGQSSTNNLHYAEVFVEKNKILEFVMEIDPKVGEGRHIIALYKSGVTGGYEEKPLFRFDFSVGPVSGIEDEAADKEGFIICQQPVEEVLAIYTATAAKDLCIYNLAGQMILQKRLENTTGNNYSIAVERLEAGCYIIALQTTDGKMYHKKFIKK